MSSILIAVLTAFLTSFLLLAGLVVAIRRIAGQIKATARLYFEPQAEDKPSEFSALVEQISIMFSKHLVGHLKTSFLGMQSVDKRNEQRIEQDMLQDGATAANPLLGAILTSFPSVGRRLAKNPALADLLIKTVASKLAGSGSTPGNNGHSKDYAEQLSLYK